MNIFYKNIYKKDLEQATEKELQRNYTAKFYYELAQELFTPYADKKITQREIKKINAVLLDRFGVNRGHTQRLVEDSQLVRCYKCSDGDIAISDYLHKDLTEHTKTVAYGYIDLDKLNKWIEHINIHISNIKKMQEDDEIQKYMDAITLLNNAPDEIKYIFGNL